LLFLLVDRFWLFLVLYVYNIVMKQHITILLSLGTDTLEYLFCSQLPDSSSITDVVRTGRD